MTERFVCPEPSDEAIANFNRSLSPITMYRLKAAYAVDLPALCRSEMNALLEHLFENAIHDIGNADGVRSRVGRWISDRFGVPEAAPPHAHDCADCRADAAMLAEMRGSGRAGPAPEGGCCAKDAHEWTTLGGGNPATVCARCGMFRSVGEPGERSVPVSASTGAGGSFSIHDPTPTAPASKRIPYGQEKAKHRQAASGPCHDCRVELGQLHVEGCDWEECERCGGQRIGCGCCVECHAADGDYLVCRTCLSRIPTAPAEHKSHLDKGNVVWRKPPAHLAGTVWTECHACHSTIQVNAADLAEGMRVAGSPPEEPKECAHDWVRLGNERRYQCMKCDLVLRDDLTPVCTACGCAACRDREAFVGMQAHFIATAHIYAAIPDELRAVARKVVG